ncbi:MAG: hypothetical protein ACE5HU_10000, partial [Acidobacteriota bacterium]
VTIFVEGSVHDRRELSRRRPQTAARQAAERKLLRDNPLVRYHDLDPRFLKLKRAHARVEPGHRHAAWSIVLEHARSGGDKMLCIEALEHSLELWHAYRDGVAAAARVSRQGRRSARRLARGS